MTVMSRHEAMLQDKAMLQDELMLQQVMLQGAKCGWWVNYRGTVNTEVLGKLKKCKR